MSNIPEEQTPLYISKLLGGTKLWYRILAHLFKTSRWNGIIGSDDPTCSVDCECGEILFVSTEKIFWCPKCHRGYATEFEVYRYPAWLYKIREKAFVPEAPEMAEHRAKLKEKYPGLYPD
jgi:hypothetical protein